MVTMLNKAPATTPTRPAAPPAAPGPSRVTAFRARFHAAIDATRPDPAARRWRTSLFERGLMLADELETRFGPLIGRRVLDMGAAYGGDAVALCARGAACVAADKFDHDYAALKAALAAGPDLDCVLADCTRRWPFPSASFDVVLCLSVLEIVDNLDFFFGELLRVLRPTGVAVIDTGTALRMARCDPLFKLPLIALLPTPARCWVAARLFGRRYRFPVSRHTFYSAAKFRRFTERRGWRVQPEKFARSPLMARLARWPLAEAWRTLVRWLAYDFVLLVPRRTVPRRATAVAMAGQALRFV